MVVVDTNIIAYYWIPGVFTELAESLYIKDTAWVSSPLWKFEFRSAVSGYIRKQLISVSEAIQLVEEAELLMNEKEITVPVSVVMNFVNKSKCSSYDCEFIALAYLLGIPLITVDKQILSEFPGIAVHIVDYLK